MRWKDGKIHHVNINKNIAGGGVLVSDEVDFSAKKIIKDRDKEEHTMIKGSIYQEETAILNVYAANYIGSKTDETERKMDKYRVGDCNIPLSTFVINN